MLNCDWLDRPNSIEREVVAEEMMAVIRTQ
jgi:hypothetical protein